MPNDDARGCSAARANAHTRRKPASAADISHHKFEQLLCRIEGYINVALLMQERHFDSPGPEHEAISFVLDMLASEAAAMRCEFFPEAKTKTGAAERLAKPGNTDEEG